MSAQNKPIACVYIPRFAVEAERMRRPETASQLILIGDATVLDCSLGADASGVRRGMRMSEAIGLCHRAEVLPPDAPYYERLLDEVLDELQTLSPTVERGELGLAWLSLAGLPVQMETFAEDLIAGMHRRFGFMSSVGAANGKFVSRVAAVIARPGAARIVPPADEREFLANLPVEHLPASEAMRWRLNLLGVATVGEVAAFPLGAFQAQFGQEGKRCWQLAQGIDDEPLVPRVKEDAVVRRLQLPAPIAALDTILVGVERLLRAAYGDHSRGCRWVRKAVVRAALDGGGSWELPVPFREALSDPRDAWSAVKAAVVRHPPERPVEELEVELVGLSYESGKQASMFEGKGRLWQQVEEAVRQLGAQRDRPSLGKVMQVDPQSRIPERRAALLAMESDV